MKHISLGSTGGVETIIHVSDDELITENRSDDRVERRIMAENAELRTMRQNPISHGRFAARIPLGMREKWKREYERGPKAVMEWGQFLIMKINSSDFAKVRIHEKGA